MKSEITLSKLSPLRLSMSKISFNFLSKIFSPKLLFVFSFVLVFSFTQVNFSSAQARDLTCYVLAGKIVDINGVSLPDFPSLFGLLRREAEKTLKNEINTGSAESPRIKDISPLAVCRKENPNPQLTPVGSSFTFLSIK